MPRTSRAANGRELDALIAEWTSSKTIAELETLMIAHSVPAGRVYRGPEMLADPHFAARAALIAVPHPELGAITMQAPMPKLSATPSTVRRPAPVRVGEHNAEVYGALGFDAAALAGLAARGVI